MCSASMGAEGSVTLQLREAVQAPISDSGTLNNVTIGYPDPEVFADMLGTFQAAGTDSTFDIVENGSRPQNITNTFFKANGLTATTINKTETGTCSVQVLWMRGKERYAERAVKKKGISIMKFKSGY